MAGVVCHATSGEVALTAATAKTVLQIKAPANQRVLVSAIRITGKQPAGGTDTPVKVRLTRSTSAFGTGSAATVAKNDPTDSETVQTSCFAAFTAEPTSTDGGFWVEVQPQSGYVEVLQGMEIKVPGGQSLNVELTSPATPTLAVTATFTE